MSEPITGATTAQEAKEPADRIREQRRYEIARDCMAAMSADINNSMSNAALAETSVECADALLAALEGKR